MGQTTSSVTTPASDWIATAAEILQDTDEGDRASIEAMRALRDAMNRVGAIRILAALADATDFATDAAREDGSGELVRTQLKNIAEHLREAMIIAAT